MEWLNYHHLLYFWTAAREGGVTAASRKLRLAQPTVSGQIKQLEDALGERLFVRRGRKLELTDVGRTVYRYADEIFGLGRELLDTVKGRPTGRPGRLSVGVSDALPKLIAHRILAPLLEGVEPPRLVVREETAERLVSALLAHELDVVLSDAPIGGAKVFHHALGESGVTLFACGKQAAKLRGRFPASLDGAELLLPAEGSALRRGLEGWFERLGVRPIVRGEFEDSALMKTFGQAGAGAFFTATSVEAEVSRQYDVKVCGRTEEVRERFWALTAERKIQHPLVLALTRAARASLAGGAIVEDS